uniref:t-SNARE coiled-coil homology domain-containing protein n=2 Tax=Ditylum brightwellii TaxID=49249 RepID=A0A7S4VKK9_9STRA|mmetsp:Transcript_7271/g.9678  ORF Transcript_7271/g.9678 Transcript_7271/m.9678 type:complete len:424 (-) Transcript_7271:435-1706(-)
MSQDRTPEFFAFAQSLPASNLNSDVGLSSVNNMSSTGRYGRSTETMTQPYGDNSAASELRNFHAAASEISRDIAATSTMLSELSQLVRRRTLFNDDNSRVNDLVLRIKSNIENLNGRLDDAGSAIEMQKRRLGRNSQVGQEASNLVGQLREEFVRATTGFRHVLQQRTDTMKENKERKAMVFGDNKNEASQPDDDLFALGNKPPVYGTAQDDKSSMSQPSSLMSFSNAHKLDLTSGLLKNQVTPAGESTSSYSNLPRPLGVAGEGGGNAYNAHGLRLRHSISEPLRSSYDPDPMPNLDNFSSGGAPLTPLDIQRMEEESGQSQTLQLIPDQNYLRERADAMSTVETNIVELGTIFNKLAVMVGEHREMVERLEDNVDDANQNISLTFNTLTDTLNNLQSNRQLAMKLFGIVALFIVLFITFFA